MNEMTEQERIVRIVYLLGEAKINIQRTLKELENLNTNLLIKDTNNNETLSR